MAKKILLAEDSATMQQVVQMTFAAEDYNISATSSADDAVTQAKRLNPDVIIADISLPGKDGYTLCKTLKDAGVRAPVVLMYGVSSGFDADRARQVGADENVEKPYDTQELIDKVRALAAAASHVSVQGPIESLAAPIGTVDEDVLIEADEAVSVAPAVSAPAEKPVMPLLPVDLPTPPSAPGATAMPRAEMPVRPGGPARTPMPVTPAIGGSGAIRGGAATGGVAQRPQAPVPPRPEPMAAKPLTQRKAPTPPPALEQNIPGVARPLPGVEALPGLEATTPSPLPLSQAPLAAKPGVTSPASTSIPAPTPTAPMGSSFGGASQPLPGLMGKDMPTAAPPSGFGDDLTAKPAVSDPRRESADAIMIEAEPPPSRPEPMEPFGIPTPGSALPKVEARTPEPVDVTLRGPGVPDLPPPPPGMALPGMMAPASAPKPPQATESPKQIPADIDPAVYEAITRLSRDVIERIVWEIVPDLAETIIREQIERLVERRK